jgi:hypothetical protein
VQRIGDRRADARVVLMVAHAQQLDRRPLRKKPVRPSKRKVRMPKRVSTRSTTSPSTTPR